MDTMFKPFNLNQSKCVHKWSHSKYTRCFFIAVTYFWCNTMQVAIDTMNDINIRPDNSTPPLNNQTEMETLSFTILSPQHKIPQSPLLNNNLLHPTV